MPAVIAAADTRLRGLRQHVPDAGGMIIASDQTAARAYADLLRTITGEAPTVVLSDDKGSSDRISQFSAGTIALAGRRAHGVRGRRRAAAGRRRVRHQRVDAAVLRAGDRPLRAVAAARRDGQHLPAVGAQPAAAGQRDGGPAQSRPGQAAPGDARGPPRCRAGRAEARRAGPQREGHRVPGRRRRTRSGDLRRVVVRHRDARGQRGGGRLPRHPGPARHRLRCEICCGAGRKSS